MKNIIISLVFISIALFSNKSFSQTSSLKLGCFGGTNVIGNKAGKLNKSGLDFGFALLLSNKSPLEIQMNFGLSKKRLLASSLEFNNNTLDGYFNYYPTYWSYEIPLLFKYNFTKVKKVLPLNIIVGISMSFNSLQEYATSSFYKCGCNSVTERFTNPVYSQNSTTNIISGFSLDNHQ